MAPDPLELPYFFLGYAHAPQQPWVRRFYQALCDEIIDLTEWPTHVPPGFMDENGIKPGADWRQAVAGALATCRVLVPLYSRRYFTRIECGREWHAFQSRMLEHRARQGGNTVPIVPALWAPVPDRFIPEAVRDVHVDFAAVHPMYAQEGLSALIKNSSYRAPYRRVLRHLAERIIDAAESEPLSRCTIDDIDVSRNAFEQPRENIPADRRLTIMVAAPVLAQLPPGRAAAGYDTKPEGWSPFRPESTMTLAEAAARLARTLDYDAEIVSADEGLTKKDWSRPQTGLGLLLVDPWLALDADAADQLQAIDNVGIGRVATVLAWSLRDPQTRRRADEIRDALRRAAPRLGDPGTPAALGALRVGSVQEFMAQLPSVLDRVSNQYLNAAEAQPPPGAVSPQPHLQGPVHTWPVQESQPQPRTEPPTAGGHDEP